MEEGPWIFRGYALILKEFDGSTAIPATVPDKLLAWVQIHRIPPLYHTHAILTQLAGKVEGQRSGCSRDEGNLNKLWRFPLCQGQVGGVQAFGPLRDSLAGRPGEHPDSS